MTFDVFNTIGPTVTVDMSDNADSLQWIRDFFGYNAMELVIIMNGFIRRM